MQSARAPFGPILILTFGAVLAAFGLLAPLAHWLIEPTALPPPFGVQNQDAETIIFVLTFAVALPVAVLLVPRIADRVATSAGVERLESLAALSGVLLLGLLVLLKLSERLPWDGGLGTLFVLSLGWIALTSAGVALCLAGRGGALPPLERLRLPLLIVAAGLLLALVLSFAQLDSVAVVPLVAGLLVACAVGALAGRPLPQPPRWAGIGWDVIAVLLILLVVPNLVVFSPENPAADTETTIIQFHQDFFLGPANHVLGGGAMLIDTFSQYGVASIYLLDAWFLIAPIGNGTLALLEGLLTAGVFALAYLILRGAGAGRLLASSAMGVGVVILVLNLVYPIGALLQHGSIRFGLPIVVIAAAVLEARRPDRATLARALQLLTVALASIWALEAFAYTLITFAGLTLFELSGATARWRLLALRAGQVVAACVAAHLLFALVTLLAVGELPRWGVYIQTLRDFLTGDIGDLTYDFVPWSGGLGTGALLVASSAGIALLALRHRALVEERRVTLVALAGSTAWGIALFTYFVNRSADHILPYVSLPVLMVVVLWLSLLLRPATTWSPSRLARGFALGAAAGAAAVLVSIAWSGAGERFSQSALAYAVPGGGPSLKAGLERLWDPPELADGAAAGERLLDEYMPGEHESLVLTSADAGIEILMETERVNRIPLSDPWEDSIVPDEHIDNVRDAVAELEPGDRMLIDEDGLRVFKELQRNPGDEQVSEATLVPSGLAYLQEVALREIADRFRLKRIASDGPMLVEELVER